MVVTHEDADRIRADFHERYQAAKDYQAKREAIRRRQAERYRAYLEQRAKKDREWVRRRRIRDLERERGEARSAAAAKYRADELAFTHQWNRNRGKAIAGVRSEWNERWTAGKAALGGAYEEAVTRIDVAHQAKLDALDESEAGDSEATREG